MPKKIPDNIVLEAYRRLGTGHKAGIAIGVPGAYVLHVLHRNGIHIGRGRNQKLHDQEAILRLWHQHHNQHTVAGILGIHQSAVSRILNRNGIRIGKGGFPTHHFCLREAARLYDEGKSYREIGQLLGGIDDEVVRRRLARRGHHSRPRGHYEKCGPNNPQWKGGHHPTMHYYRRQAYEVAAICLGQPLARGLIIHHNDEDPKNNCPENLLIFQSASAHAHYHQQLLRLQQEGRPVDAIQLALGIGARRLPPPPHPIVLAHDTSPRRPYKRKAPPAPPQINCQPAQRSLFQQ